jgi:hypothetical protein
MSQDMPLGLSFLFRATIIDLHMQNLVMLYVGAIAFGNNSIKRQLIMSS